MSSTKSLKFDLLRFGDKRMKSKPRETACVTIPRSEIKYNSLDHAAMSLNNAKWRASDR